MTLTIELPPELDERLQKQAGREGYTAEEYARKVLEERLLPGNGSPSVTSATSEERLSAYQRWVNSHAGTPPPPLSDEAISRESIYGEREDRQL